MNDFLEKLTEINSVINDFIWAKIGIVLLIFAGAYLTYATRFFQVRHFSHWLKCTLGSVFDKKYTTIRKEDNTSISQFQSLCTSLSATMGTGNIVGVANAIALGGPGAVFWMWVAAFLGMMTNFTENVLGIYYRRKNKSGEWTGGAMYYLRDGVGEKLGHKKLGNTLAFFFSIFTILATFGIGNMAQVNKITSNLKSAFFANTEFPEFLGFQTFNWFIGIFMMTITGIVIIGGIKRVANIAERIVPVMSLFYILGSLIILFINFDSISKIFGSILKFAFGAKAAIGGFTGYAMKEVLTQGFKRGVFSNEAGLGSSVMIHSSSDVREPVKQGMWGIFEVFFDTIVFCSMTAFVVLSSGYINLETGALLPGADEATLVSKTFGIYFGFLGESFISLTIFLLAFTTLIGWSQYGCIATEYLLGEKSKKYYRIIFSLITVIGALVTSSMAWEFSDTANGLMMIPNLIGLYYLSPVAIEITKNYVARKFHHETRVPMLSAFPDIQKQHEKDLEDGKE